MYDKWSVLVYENPGIVSWSPSSHFYFWNENTDMPDFDPSFSSPHVNILNADEVYRAFVRTQTLLRIISGVRILSGGRRIRHCKELHFFENGYYKKPRYNEDLDVFLEELTNPFDQEVVKEIRSKDVGRNPNMIEFIIDESIDDYIARDILLWIALGEEDLLYFITNAYKIMDSIRADTEVDKKNSELVLSDDLIVAIKKMKKHFRYMNTYEGSGRLSRHGNTRDTGPSKKPSIDIIKQDLIEVVREWFKYRYFLKHKKQ
ncbi:hypothetical protein [Sporosarcina trichiuri]|uniref:hypothetical protein n=1 Tax=Sporosarcina trichiuri TaxID=3056445 RepID=UPI0025B3EB7E|nr:hypothetical protein [Sporosarcina sp. 0.2-SM1T-5]WJY28273.1 hypothetical protein QWT68_04630 [Sporosarcina sp. 0.2-SM1T-5]